MRETKSDWSGRILTWPKSSDLSAQTDSPSMEGRLIHETITMIVLVSRTSPECFLF